MKRAVAAMAVFLCAAPLAAQAQQAPSSPSSSKIDPALRALALRAVKAATPESNFRALVTQMTVAMSGQAFQARGVPPAAADEMTKILVSELATIDLELVYDLVADMYAARFTADELSAMEAFYTSPAGRKLVAAQPELAQAGMKAGQIWGATVLAPRIVARLTDLMRERNLNP